MSEELSNALISLGSATDIKIMKPGKALPVAQKKDVVHIPQVKEGFQRLFPSFYEVNHQNEVDPKTRKRVKEKETFTRFLQPAGGEKTAIFTTREIYFIPLYFKFGRLYYEGAYNPNEKKAPDCQSTNGIVPQTAKFAKSCEECPYSKWQNTTPPPCGEMPELLMLDMTAKTIKDPELAAAVTAEAVTISFKKSAIKAVKDLMKKLAEPVLFEDGTYSPIDMTQYLVKATLEVAINDGKEANYCTPAFEIVGQVPFEVSEKLIAAINTPNPLQGNKTALELFIGRTEPFAELDKSTGESEAPAAPTSAKKVEKVAPPKSRPVTETKLADEQTIEVTAELAPASVVTEEEVQEAEEVQFEPTAPAPVPAPAPAAAPKAAKAVSIAPAATVQSDDDEVVF